MKIGIIGGGQLARLLILENNELDYHFTVLAEKDIANLYELCDFRTYDSSDPSMLVDFIKQCDVVTIEEFNLSTDVLEMLQQSSVVDKLFPQPKSIARFADKVKEKDYFRFMRVPTNEYRAVYSKDHALMAAESLTFPLYIKSRGNSATATNQLVQNTDELKALPENVFTHALIEEKTEFNNEISITGCRDQFGNSAFYDLSLNIADQGSLYTSKNTTAHPLFETAKNYLQRLMISLNYVGVCTLKFFEVNGELIANSFSPRPHESANWTIDATTCNQFSNHLQVISGKKVGNINRFTDATIFNLTTAHPDNALPSYIKYYDYKTPKTAEHRLGHLTIVRSSFKSVDEYHNAVNHFIAKFKVENSSAVND